MFSDIVTNMYGHKQQRKEKKPNGHTQNKPRERDVLKLLYLNMRKAITIFCNVNSWTGGCKRLLSSLSKKKIFSK